MTALSKLAGAKPGWMLAFSKRTARSALLATAGLAAAAMASAPAAAQYIGSAPPPPAALAPGAIESPSAALARNVRILAGSPRNFAALISAGRAALDLGDFQAAIGFFGRADEERPSDPAPKIGMGAAALQSGNAFEALSWFDQAQRLGASAAVLGADRGLARDLAGELDAAQADYRAALSGPQSDEARRRLALSLAISGKMVDGLRILDPLVQRHDPAAQRIRAFVLALGGEQALAVRAIDQAMPGAAERMAPFFQQLPRLSARQKAAAVHLGVFPTPGEVQLAAVIPAPQPAPVRREAAPAPPKRERAAKAVKLAPGRRPMASPPQPVAIPVQQVVTPAPSPVAPVVAAQSPPAIPDVPASDRLSGIDRLLAAAAEPLAVAPAKNADRRKAPSDGKAAAAKKESEAKKDAAAKKAAEAAKARDEAAKIGVAGLHWVQLAGGTHRDRLAGEFKRIKDKKPALFAGRAGYSTAGKDYFRLLVGPFDDAEEARAFAAKLAKAGIDGFSWMRSPPALKIEKLTPK